jgi:ERCC4-related helicase
MRSALVDYFREEGRIMIATEAGAEGINLQFCALVVNYDLPWNPQRIEQRIGRCHRYGQKKVSTKSVLNLIQRNAPPWRSGRVFAASQKLRHKLISVTHTWTRWASACFWHWQRWTLRQRRFSFSMMYSQVLMSRMLSD